MDWGGNADLAKCKNIGEGFVLMHGIGTVFNAASVIGKNCTVLHNVTIGAGRGGAPTLGDNVYVGAGALIIGGVKIGDNVKLGAGAIVVEDMRNKMQQLLSLSEKDYNQMCDNMKEYSKTHNYDEFCNEIISIIEQS